MCPNCQGHHWVIDCDFRAAFMAGGVDVDYDQRDYTCRDCDQQGPGHKVLQKSPPTFLIDLQLGGGGRELSASDKAYWEAVLREQFLDHPLVPFTIRRKRPWWRIC